MRCRGGEALVFDKTPGAQLPTAETMMNVSMNFIAGTQAVSGDGQNLQPGQCSWLDRGLRPREPARLKLEIVDFAQLARQRHGTPVDTSPTAAERFPDAQNIPNLSEGFKSFLEFRRLQHQRGLLPGDES